MICGRGRRRTGVRRGYTKRGSSPARALLVARAREGVGARLGTPRAGKMWGMTALARPCAFAPRPRAAICARRPARMMHASQVGPHGERTIWRHSKRGKTSTARCTLASNGGGAEGGGEKGAGAFSTSRINLPWWARFVWGGPNFISKNSTLRHPNLMKISLKFEAKWYWNIL